MKKKLSLFDTSQKKLYEIFFYRTSVRNDLKSFYIDIKTIERVKKQTVLKKYVHFKGK